MVCELGIAVHNTSASHHYEGSHNWGQPQPLQLGCVEAYIEAAYERRRAFRDVIEEFAAATGPGAVIVQPCVKSFESATRKLWDRTSSSLGQPDMIADYLRGRVLVPSNPGDLRQLTGAIDHLIGHPLMAAYKDRIYRPDGSGFRAFNARLNIDGLHTELQILPDDRYGKTRAINTITEGLRGTERGIREAEERFDMVSGGEVMVKRMSKLVNKAEETIDIVRDMRKAFHELAAEVTGVNALRDPNFAPPIPAGEPARALEMLFDKLERSKFGRNAASRLEDTLQWLIAEPSPFSHRLAMQ